MSSFTSSILSLLMVIICAQSATQPPNIVFIMGESVASSAYFFGKEAPMPLPNLQYLMRNGVSFPQTYAAAPVCNPSRATTITGRRAHSPGHYQLSPNTGLYVNGTWNNHEGLDPHQNNTFFNFTKKYANYEYKYFGQHSLSCRVTSWCNKVNFPYTVNASGYNHGWGWYDEGGATYNDKNCNQPGLSCTQHSSVQAFDCIIKRRLNTVSKLQIFINKELHFKSDEEWIKFYYERKINEIGTNFDSINAMKKCLSENKENKLILSSSNDLKIIESNCLLNLNLFRESYTISTDIKSCDNYNILSLISHIICLVELGKQSELYKTSHDLICTYPSSAISWFSVGCYYYMTRRYEISHRFLHKATSLDKYFFAAWIVYGHTFSEQDADDQAKAAYRTVNRYFPNSYQPLLFMGMGYLNMNNYIYAEKFLKEAYKLFDSDPMRANDEEIAYTIDGMLGIKLGEYNCGYKLDKERLKSEIKNKLFGDSEWDMALECFVLQG